MEWIASKVGNSAIRFYRILFENETSYAIRNEQGTGYVLLNWDQTGAMRLHDRIIPVQSTVLLPPVVPSKIIAVGLNYRPHALEMKMEIPEEPVIFMKPLTSLAASGEAIQYPVASQQVDYEGELALVIGAKGRCIPEQHALDFIMGYTLANDITARDLQKRDGQWTRAKGFDGFCPIGPCVQTGLPAAELEFKTFLNGELRQVGRMSDMIFSIPKIVAFVSEVMTLLPGDVIITGTPPGIGPMQPGDVVRVECESIGVLENRITRL